MRMSNSGHRGSAPPDKKKKRVVGTSPAAHESYSMTKQKKTARQGNGTTRYSQGNHSPQKRRTAINPSQDREAALREQARRRKQKIRRRQFFVYAAVLLLVAGVGITLSLTVFFHIETIAVEGNSKYASEEIIAKIDIHEQDNLFLSDIKAAEEAISTDFPYIKAVNIKRILPSKILISVTETTAAFVIEEKGTYTLLDSAGRVLETGLASAPVNLPVIKGVEFASSNIGETAVYKDDTLGPVMEKVMTAVASCDIGKQEYIGETTPLSGQGNIDVVDLTDTLDIRLVFDNRLTLKLGTPTDLEYKLEFAKTAINELPANARGSLDLSVLKKATYSPEKTEPSSAQATTQAPEQSKGEGSQ